MTSPLLGACQSHPGASRFRIAGLQGCCAWHRTLPPGCLLSFLCKTYLCMLPGPFSWCRELNDKPPPGCMPVPSRGWSVSDSGVPGLLRRAQNTAARLFEIISVHGMPLHAAGAFTWCRELNDKPPPGCMPVPSRGWSVSDSGASGLLRRAQNTAARLFDIISVQDMPLHAAGAFTWCRELNDKPPPGCMPVPSRGWSL